MDDIERPKPMTSAGRQSHVESEVRRRANARGGREHLRQPQAEDGFAHHPEARRLKLEADDEHQEYDAELRNVLRGVDLADQPEAGGADDDAGGEVAEHRAQLEVAEYGDRDDRRGEEYGDLRQQAHN